MTDHRAVVETLLETSRKKGMISEHFRRSLLSLLLDDRVSSLDERAFKNLLQKVEEAVSRHADMRRSSVRIRESCRSIRAGVNRMNRQLTAAVRFAGNPTRPEPQG